MPGLPAVIGRYQIRERLNPESRTSAVYLAVDPGIDRRVALKLLKIDDEQARDAFLREARAAARLQHPNLVTIFDVGEHEGQPYIVMEYVQGDTLAELIRRRAPISLRRKLQLMTGVCEGLAYAHRHGILHRAVRPDNVLVSADSGGVKILNLAAPRLTASTSVTASGATIVEAPNYLSPEQVHGQPGTQRDDIFALGAVFYELLVYRRAFEGDTPLSILYQIAYHEPESITAIDPTLDSRLSAILNRALAKDSAARYGDLQLMRHDLARYVARLELAEQEGDATIPAPTTAPAPRRSNSVRRGTEGNRQTSDRPLYLDDNVQFSVYRPKMIEPERWYALLVFAHLAERRPDEPDAPDPVEEVRRQAREAFREDLSGQHASTTDSAQSVPRKGELTLIPVMDGVEFDPVERRFRWDEPVHRESFRLRAVPSTAARVARGRLTVFLGNIILAEVALAIRVQAGVAEEAVPTPEVDRGRRCRQIFACYSHHDYPIVEEFEELAGALGDIYLRDVKTLRSGQRWQPALRELIDRANLFQLFWSWNALASPYVRDEYEYALARNTRDFIRPVYWEQPFPEKGGLPPPALRELHFYRISPRGRLAEFTDSEQARRLAREQAVQRSLARARELANADRLDEALASLRTAKSLDPEAVEPMLAEVERREAALREARARQQAEAESRRRAAEEEAIRRRAEEVAKSRREEERRAAEESARRAYEEALAAGRRAEEDAIARRRAEKSAVAGRRAEEAEAARRQPRAEGMQPAPLPPPHDIEPQPAPRSASPLRWPARVAAAILLAAGLSFLCGSQRSADYCDVHVLAWARGADRLQMNRAEFERLNERVTSSGEESFARAVAFESHGKSIEAAREFDKAYRCLPAGHDRRQEAGRRSTALSGKPGGGGS